MAKSAHLVVPTTAVYPPTSFDIAFERLRDTVSKDDARAFASSKMEDVWATAKDIERQLEERRSLRGFRRIQPFLEAVEQYSKVIEVSCNQTPYLPFIWVRFRHVPEHIANARPRLPSNCSYRCVPSPDNGAGAELSSDESHFEADCSRAYRGTRKADRGLCNDRRGYASLRQTDRSIQIRPSVSSSDGLFLRRLT